MPFEFATATRIIFGAGKLSEIGPIAAEMGSNVLVVAPGQVDRAQPLINLLVAQGMAVIVFSVAGEPTIPLIQSGVDYVHDHGCDMVVAFGGGSVIDASKAIAALATNDGEPLDYLEVIGKGQALTNPPLPFIAIPTTAGTGSEVTRNAVLASPEHRVKVSLRSPLMLPRVALVDPELTYSMPAPITAATGMDALTQVLEPYVSHRANPVTDGFCREGLVRSGRSLRRVYENGADVQAREDMAQASLLGGLALANSGLGAVHGFAGVLGGMFDAPHGAICARLLPFVTETNVQALQAREPDNPALPRYDEVARILTGDLSATATDAIRWIADLGAALAIPPLSEYGITSTDIPVIVEKSAKASSMKANPLVLTAAELSHILEQAL